MPTNKADYQRQYYLNNKDKILNQVKATAILEVECVCCKKMVKKSSINAHKQTKMHKYKEQINNIDV